MTKFFLLLAGLLANTCSYSQTFVLEGTTPSKLNGVRIDLIISEIYDQSRHETKYSTKVEAGRFTISGSLRNPTTSATLSSSNHGFYLCAIDTGVNIITVRPLPAKTPFYKNQLSNAVMEKSISNTVCREIADMQNNFFVKNGKPSPSNKNIIVLDSSAKAQMARQELAILKQNNAVYYSLVYLYQLYLQHNRSLNHLKEVFQSFTDSIKATPLAQELADLMKKSEDVLVGKQVPPMVLIDTLGNNISPEFLKGKNYLLAFGATWCKPCKKNYPLLRELYARYKDSNFEIISINLDENKTEWLRQIRQFELTWTHVSELKPWKENQNSKTFEVHYLPLYILVDRNGKMVYNSMQSKDYGGSKLNEHIRAVTQ